ATAASAQTHPYGDAPYGTYPQHTLPPPVAADPYRNGGYGDADSSQGVSYEWARVLRVDPVLVQGAAPVSDNRNCRTQRDYYAADGGYGRDEVYRDDGYYGNDPYADDVYR